MKSLYKLYELPPDTFHQKVDDDEGDNPTLRWAEFFISACSLLQAQKEKNAGQYIRSEHAERVRRSTKSYKWTCRNRLHKWSRRTGVNWDHAKTRHPHKWCRSGGNTPRNKNVCSEPCCRVLNWSWFPYSPEITAKLMSHKLPFDLKWVRTKGRI